MPSSAPVRQLKKWLFGNRKYHVQIVGGPGYNSKSSLLYHLRYPGKPVEESYWNPMLDYNRETIDYPAGWEFDVLAFREGYSRFEAMNGHFCFLTSETLVWYVHDCARPDVNLEWVQKTVAAMKDKGAKYLWLLLSEQHCLPTKNDERPRAVARHKAALEALLQAEAAPAGITWFYVDEPGFTLYLEGPKYALSFVKGVAKTLLELEKKEKSARDATTAVAANKNDNNYKEAALTFREKARGDETLRARLEQVEKALEQQEGGDSEGLRDVARFWDDFVHARLTSWTHVDHLEAGYLVLLRSMAQGHGLLKTASAFVEHLARLKEARPDVFRNTAHFTMTAFWIIQLRVAVFNFQFDDDGDDATAPQVPITDQDFRDVLLCSPQLLDTRLWAEYYSQEVLLSPAAREDFVMPDVKPFPQVTKPVLTAMVKGRDGKDLESEEEEEEEAEEMDKEKEG